MPSLFPILLSLTGFIPFIFRVIAGSYFLFTEAKYLKSETQNKKIVLPALRFAGGLLLVAGLFTQGAALFLFVCAVAGFGKREKRVEYLFLSAILLSLVVSGAGFFAFDMPF